MGHNIQDFAQQGFNGGLPGALQQRPPQPIPQGFAPQQVNFGGQQQPPAQQQITQSQILGLLLSGQLGNIPQSQDNAFGGLQNAIFQRGILDAQQRNSNKGLAQSASQGFIPSAVPRGG